MADQRLKQLFHQACQVPAAERARWVVQACGDDVDLRRELESLLDAHRRAAGFLETPALAALEAAEAVFQATLPEPARERTGSHLGPYRVLRELGRGGMGMVYLGARDDDAFERLVAIKVVQGLAIRPTLRGRFEEERRILAGLDHPGIARLLDAGSADDGVPYVVMEYVDGEPIDVYCRRRRLSIRDRVALFFRVCEAIQYSHQRLVVHRDIKAGNILVTAEGVPKLLDFGIAKMLEPDDAPSAATRTILRALTLESASPEQVRGETVTVASDVYSLGILLYRLLTDLSPYRTQPASEAEMVRAVCEEEAPRPSEAASARELRGDLDVITLKALRKEPERRYASVEQLAEDLRRHLTGHPVSARPESIRYRTVKFMARHRVTVAAAAVVVLSLAAAWVETSRQRARAERRLTDVRKLAGSFLFEFHDAIAHLSGATAARELVVKKGVDYLTQLSAEESRDPTLLVETADAWRRLAGVQGMPLEFSLGHTEDARRSLEKALELLDRLPGSERQTSSAGLSRARTLVALGALSAAQGRSEDSVRRHQEAAQILEAIAAGVDEATLREERYNISLGLGDALWETGDLSSATAEYQRTLARIDGWLQHAPDDAKPLQWAGVLAQRIGDALALQKRWPEALAYQQRSTDIDERLAAREPDNAKTQSDLGMDYERLALAHSNLQDEPAALRELDRATAIFERLSAADPLNAQLAILLAEARGLRARSLGRLGRDAEASLAFRQSIGAYRARVASDATNVRWREQLAERLAAQGSFLAARRRFEEARRAFAEARELREALARERPEYATNRSEIASLCQEQATVELDGALASKGAGRCAGLHRALASLACASSAVQGLPAGSGPFASGADWALSLVASVDSERDRIGALLVAAACGS